MPFCRVLLIAVLAFMANAPAKAEKVDAVIDGVAALNVRRGPGQNAPTVGQLKRGTAVTIEAEVGDWVLVRTDEVTGYAYRKFVKPIVAVAPTPHLALPSTEPLPGSADAPPALAPSPTPLIAALDPDTEDDLRRLLTLTRELHDDMQKRRIMPTAMPSPSDSAGIQSGLGLLALGGVIGFLIGSAVGRQHDKHSSSRVRF